MAKKKKKPKAKRTADTDVSPGFAIDQIRPKIERILAIDTAHRGSSPRANRIRLSNSM